MADARSALVDAKAAMRRYEVSPWRPLLAFALFVFAVMVAGYLVFNGHKQSTKREAQHQLAAIAALKIGQISSWVVQNKAHAQVLGEDQLFLSAVNRWLAAGAADDATGKVLRGRLISLQRAHQGEGYTSLTLFDAAGVPRLSTSGQDADVDDREEVLDALRRGQIVLSDIHLAKSRSAQRVEIELAIPLYLGGNGRAHPIGAVLFRIDPERFLFPLVQSWPTASRSAENLIVRREGDQVVFLNELRYKKFPPLSFRLPVTQTQYPAVMAVRGVQGMVEGTDYRGVPVVGVLSRIPGTDWLMVSKIDKAEIDAPIHQLANWMSALAASLILVGALIAAFWHRREARYHHHIGKLEREQLEKRLDDFIRHANDIIVLSDDSGTILDFNDRAVSAYGYSREQLLLQTEQALCAPACVDQLHEQRKRLELERHLQFETMHRRRDGTVFPVESSVSLIEIEGKRYYQSISRDITERKRAEEQLWQQKNLLRKVIDTDPNLISVKDGAGRLQLVNQAWAQRYGLSPREVVGKTHWEINHYRQEVAQFLDLDREVIEKQVESVETLRISEPDGESRWYRVTKVPLLQPDGEPSVLSISVDISQLVNYEIELKESFSRLQQRAYQVNNALDDERRRIARELHDEMGAILAALNMSVRYLAKKLPVEIPQVAAQIERMTTLVSSGIGTMRHIVTQLRPGPLDHLGLVAAIEFYARDFQKRTSIECRLKLPGEPLALGDDASSMLFRVFQESMTNLERHAEATSVEISLRKRGKSLRLAVEDNGKGFDMKSRKLNSFGLAGIRERALMLGGKAHIASSPGKGTRVSVLIPLQAAESNAPSMNA